ncbi:MAG TPA: MarR family transcriptional regulator [Ornithinicoccus sp.]|nr:MarR family transcriptional regulator [Ornithinicoccus sp.]
MHHPTEDSAHAAHGRPEHHPIDADTTELELIQHLARHLRRGSAVETAEWGLSPHQARALGVIARNEARRHRRRAGGRARADNTDASSDSAAAGAGSEEVAPGLRLGTLAGWLQITPRSVTEVVDALEGLGLVARTPDPADRRAVLVGLTDQGRQTARSIRSARKAQSETILDELSPEQRAQLRASLLTLIDAAQR